jgi:hypothetical protein
MLRKQILAVELAAALPSSLPTLPTGTKLAHPSAEIQVLRRDVAFPLVLAGERGLAASELEDADEGACVRGRDVALQ